VVGYISKWGRGAEGAKGDGVWGRGVLLPTEKGSGEKKISILDLK